MTASPAAKPPARARPWTPPDRPLPTIWLPGADKPVAFITLAEACEATRTTRQHWRNLIARGEVRAVKVGNSVRVPAIEFIKVLKPILPGDPLE